MKTGLIFGKIRKLEYGIIILALLAVLTGSAWAEIIPADRRIQWDPGVKGGIPARATEINCKISYGAIGDGITNDTNSVINCLNGINNGEAAYLPAGTYKISNTIKIPSNKTLRGAGIGITIIKGASGFSGNFLIGMQNPSYDYGWNAVSSYNLINGYNKDSTIVTTSSAHGWAVGDYIIIDQLNDPAGNPPITSTGSSGLCGWCSRDNGARPIGQWNKVVAVPTVTTATLETPLYWNYDLTKIPQGTQSIGLIQNAGIEDLTIDNSVSGARDTTRMDFTVNSWWLRVELIGSHRRMLDNWGGYRNTIKACIFHEGDPASPISSNYGPNRAYGIFMNMLASAYLIEDNIFYNLSFALSLEGGPSGNVIAYNFATRMLYQDPEWGRLTFGTHGAHPMMNLMEGNWVEDKFSSDFYWGSSSHQTFFRNRLTQPTGKIYGNWGIDVYKKNYYFNIVGNVLGTVGFETIYAIDGTQNWPYGNAKSIYRLGYAAPNDNTISAHDDPLVETTMLRHGNWDSVTQTTIWDSSTTDHNLPNSLYLTSKPAFFGTKKWPAIGPDLSPMTGSIPAKDRYEGGGSSTTPKRPANPQGQANP